MHVKYHWFGLSMFLVIHLQLVIVLSWHCMHIIISVTLKHFAIQMYIWFQVLCTNSVRTLLYFVYFINHGLYCIALYYEALY